MTALSVHQMVSEIERIVGVSTSCLNASPKVLAHPARFAKFLSGCDSEIVPVNIEIWPTLLCNARCKWCPFFINKARIYADQSNESTRLRSLEILRESRRDNHKHLMPTELWTKLASEFKKAGGLSVTFTGGGEPTVHPDLEEFARTADANGLYWGLYSNGFELTPTRIDALLKHSPQFIRISVNRWSSESHHDLYRLGLNAYERVLQNLMYLMRRGEGVATTIGIGYVLSHASPSELEGIATFIKTACSSGGKLDYVGVRPELVHYDQQGQPIARQPHYERFGNIPEMCERMLGPVCSAHGVSLQVNKRGFQAVAHAEPPIGCLSTPWVACATDEGRLFLLSEANGSPQAGLAELCYGDLSAEAFLEAWNSSARRKLTKDFENGVRTAPVWHKTSGLDQTLREIRHRVGILDPLVAETVATNLARKWPQPPHWMFI